MNTVVTYASNIQHFLNYFIWIFFIALIFRRTRDVAWGALALIAEIDFMLFFLKVYGVSILLFGWTNTIILFFLPPLFGPPIHLIFYYLSNGDYASTLSFLMDPLFFGIILYFSVRYLNKLENA